MINRDDATLPLPSWWMGKPADEIASLLMANALQIVTDAHGEEYARRYIRTFADQADSQAEVEALMNRLFT